MLLQQILILLQLQLLQSKKKENMLIYTKCSKHMMQFNGVFLYTYQHKYYTSQDSDQKKATSAYPWYRMLVFTLVKMVVNDNDRHNGCVKQCRCLELDDLM